MTLYCHKPIKSMFLTKLNSKTVIQESPLWTRTLPELIRTFFVDDLAFDYHRKSVGYQRFPVCQQVIFRCMTVKHTDETVKLIRVKLKRKRIEPRSTAVDHIYISLAGGDRMIGYLKDKCT